MIECPATFTAALPAAIATCQISSFAAVASAAHLRNPVAAPASTPFEKRLTLVHFSAQLKRIMWDRGAFRDCLGDV